MIFTLTQTLKAFDFLFKKTKNKKKIIIFVSFSLDSLCSLRLFLLLINTHNIIYQIVPVLNSDSLSSKIEIFKPSHSQLNESSVGLLVFINCGGSIDLTKFWFEEKDILALVIDIHRPIHHNNINDNQSIIIFDDEYFNYKDCPTDEMIEEVKSKKVFIKEDYKNEDDYEDDYEDYYEDEDEDENDNNNDEINDNNDDEINDLIENDEKSKKRTVKEGKNRLVPEKERKKLEKQREKQLKLRQLELKKEKIQSYYSGNYYGMPSSFTLYQIIEQFNIETPISLWLCITGSTYHYLNSHLVTEQYNSFFLKTQKEAKRLNLNNKLDLPVNKSTIIKRNPKENEGNEGKEGLSNKESEIFIEPHTENRRPMSIFSETDCRLLLYKYWNIYDSFLYSDFTVSSLQTWKEQGKMEINKILVLLGISLNEAKQKYTYMKSKSKELFKSKLFDISSKVLPDFVFRTFFFQLDEVNQVSAADFCCCLNALLENPFLNQTLFKGKEEEGGEENLLGESNKEDSQKGEDNERNEIYIQNFWFVFNLLSLKSSSFLTKAVELAIDYQMKMVQLGTSVIDRNLISPSKTFRYALISDVNETVKYFYSPLSLERFALFVINLYNKYRIRKNSIQQKPLLLGILNNDTNSYLVIGANLKSKENEDEKDIFSYRFKQGALRSKSNILLSSFNEAIVEISKDDMLSFLDCLLDDDGEN